MTDDGGRHNGNGSDYPYDLIGSSAAEVAAETHEVLRRLSGIEERFGSRLDQHAETLLNMGGDVAAIRREMTILRADMHRCVDSVTSQQLALEGIERKLAAILSVVKR